MDVRRKSSNYYVFYAEVAFVSKCFLVRARNKCYFCFYIFMVKALQLRAGKK